MIRFFGMAFTTGLVIFAVGALFHLLVPVCFPSTEKEYTNSTLFRPWTGWTRYYMIAHPFGFSIIFTLAFAWLRGESDVCGSVPEQHGWHRLRPGGIRRRQPSRLLARIGLLSGAAQDHPGLDPPESLAVCGRRLVPGLAQWPKMSSLTGRSR